MVKDVNCQILQDGYVKRLAENFEQVLNVDDVKEVK